MRHGRTITLNPGNTSDGLIPRPMFCLVVTFESVCLIVNGFGVYDVFEVFAKVLKPWNAKDGFGLGCGFDSIDIGRDSLDFLETDSGCATTGTAWDA